MYDIVCSRSMHDDIILFTSIIYNNSFSRLFPLETGRESRVRVRVLSFDYLLTLIRVGAMVARWFSVRNHQRLRVRGKA